MFKVFGCVTEITRPITLLMGTLHRVAAETELSVALAPDSSKTEFMALFSKLWRGGGVVCWFFTAVQRLTAKNSLHRTQIQLFLGRERGGKRQHCST